MIGREQRKGFTLIEVTLAMVIGIIMVAGATLIYNQAKTSAGNSRAKEKVVALQQLVEEFAAMNQGVYPSELQSVQALWARKRPDDWNKSPWGGVLGPNYAPTMPFGVGVANFNQTGFFNHGALTITNTSLGAPRYDIPGGANAGGLVYDYSPSNATGVYPDLMTNGTTVVKGYAVWICDQRSYWPNLVTGGKAN